MYVHMHVHVYMHMHTCTCSCIHTLHVVGNNTNFINLKRKLCHDYFYSSQNLPAEVSVFLAHSSLLMLQVLHTENQCSLESIILFMGKINRIYKRLYRSTNCCTKELCIRIDKFSWKSQLFFWLQKFLSRNVKNWEFAKFTDTNISPYMVYSNNF